MIHILNKNIHTKITPSPLLTKIVQWAHWWVHLIVPVIRVLIGHVLLIVIIVQRLLVLVDTGLLKLLMHVHILVGLLLILLVAYYIILVASLVQRTLYILIKWPVIHFYRELALSHHFIHIVFKLEIVLFIQAEILLLIIGLRVDLLLVRVGLRKWVILLDQVHVLHLLLDITHELRLLILHVIGVILVQLLHIIHHLVYLLVVLGLLTGVLGHRLLIYLVLLVELVSHCKHILGLKLSL